MDQYTQGRLVRQGRRVRWYQKTVEQQDLCFGKLLPEEQVKAALERHQVRYRECLYTPLVTIWTFLHQVLASDQSCRAAGARLLAFRGGRGAVRPGDILLADAIFCNYWMIALFLERGVDLLGRHGGKRRVDFRQGQRL